MTFLDNYDENSTSFITFLKNNIEIIHNNGDKLKGEFTIKQTAMQFIQLSARMINLNSPPITLRFNEVSDIV
jgi:hypothetical protein